MKLPNEDTTWAVLEVVGMFAFGDGVLLRFGVAWALMFWGALLLYLADARARRLRVSRKDDSV